MEIDELVQAVQTLNAEDAFRARLSLEQWRSIAPYLTRHEIRAGDLLIKQGDADRSMYFLAQGSLQIFVTGGPPGSNRIAILRTGSVVGEPGLFGDTPRTANVEAMTPCVVWALRATREHLRLAAQQAERADAALDLLAEELRLAHDALGEITGAFGADELLGEIFSRFCIGK